MKSRQELMKILYETIHTRTVQSVHGGQLPLISWRAVRIIGKKYSYDPKPTLLIILEMEKRGMIHSRWNKKRGLFEYTSRKKRGVVQK